jgi:hypothetical protein
MDSELPENETKYKNDLQQADKNSKNIRQLYNTAIDHIRNLQVSLKNKTRTTKYSRI